MKPVINPDKIFSIQSEEEFRKASMEIFRFQSAHNPVYSEFIKLLGINADAVSEVNEIPFLPVSFFRNHNVFCGDSEPELFFTSSSTTSLNVSRHYVSDPLIYRKSFVKTFELFYGDIREYCILALLPSYLEQSSSSLVYMSKELISMTGHPESGFYKSDFDNLANVISKVSSDGKKILLLGVSFALLDFAESHPVDMSRGIVMETGGMKGRRKEILREELHRILCEKFNVKKIHSEYGMTELLSQAYSSGKGNFLSPPWMKVIIRDARDPLNSLDDGQSGGINIIDLANVNSCSFIATDDLGKINADGSFQVIGRFDHSDVRGCNLLA